MEAPQPGLFDWQQLPLRLPRGQAERVQCVTGVGRRPGRAPGLHSSQICNFQAVRGTCKGPRRADAQKIEQYTARRTATPGRERRQSAAGKRPPGATEVPASCVDHTLSEQPCGRGDQPPIKRGAAPRPQRNRRGRRASKSGVSARSALKLICCARDRWREPGAARPPQASKAACQTVSAAGPWGSR